MSTFVTVGNGREPFERLLRAVAQAETLLPTPVFVQCGTTAFEQPAWTIRDFLGMEEFERRVAEASLLIMHGGAGSIINAVRGGKRPVIMPRLARYGEIVDDHQLEFAEALASENYVYLARNSEELASAIALARSDRSSHLSRGEPPLVEEIAQLLASSSNDGSRERAQ